MSQQLTCFVSLGCSPWNPSRQHHPQNPQLKLLLFLKKIWKFRQHRYLVFLLFLLDPGEKNVNRMVNPPMGTSTALSQDGEKKAPKKIYGEKKRWLQLYQIRTVWSPFFFGLAVRYRYEIHFHCDLTRGQNESWNLTEETIDIEDAAETASSLHRMEGSLPGSTSDPSVKNITNHNGHNDPQHHSPPTVAPWRSEATIATSESWPVIMNLLPENQLLSSVLRFAYDCCFQAYVRKGISIWNDCFCCASWRFEKHNNNIEQYWINTEYECLSACQSRSWGTKCYFMSYFLMETL